jgi:DUF4097 and DUF4098 domain-containing protein YvlB
MQSFETPNPISVDIDIAAGSVHLIAGDRSDTTVVVNPTEQSRKADREAAEKATIELSGQRLTVKTPKWSSYVGFRTGSVEVTVELPDKSALDVTTGFGDVNADGVFGVVNVKSGAGAIHVDKATGDVTARSGAGAIHVDQAKGLQLTSGAGNLGVNRCRGNAKITTAGDMRIAHIDGDAEIKNLNGKTWMGEVGGKLRVRSANGDITVDHALSHVDMKTANGNIAIGEVSSGEITLGTASGGLEIGIKEGSAAWVDAKTQFGRVHNRLQATEAPRDSEGEVAVQARTSFGDIYIDRSSNTREAGEK